MDIKPEVTLILMILIFNILGPVMSKKHDGKEKPDWAKKNIMDYSEADMERILDQWEEDEEPLESDELPEHLRPMPQFDINKISNSDPETIMQMTKKGRTLMSFVKVNGNPTREETETITKLWQTSLWNNHIPAERYLIDDNRAIFMYKDGSLAWQAKDYLVEQERCESVTIDSKVYEGKYKVTNDQPIKEEL